jgi:hypothetical protein
VLHSARNKGIVLPPPRHPPEDPDNTTCWKCPMGLTDNGKCKNQPWCSMSQDQLFPFWDADCLNKHNCTRPITLLSVIQSCRHMETQWQQLGPWWPRPPQTFHPWRSVAVLVCHPVTSWGAYVQVLFNQIFNAVRLLPLKNGQRFAVQWNGPFVYSCWHTVWAVEHSSSAKTLHVPTQRLLDQKEDDTSLHSSPQIYH